jgi:hypothetical protein
MKKLILASILVFQLNASGQTIPNWTIGLEFSAEDLSISNEDGETDFLNTDGDFNGYAILFDKNNFSIGLKADYAFTEKLSLSSGLLYSNKDFSGIYNCASCIALETFIETIEQRFLIVPIAINYSFLKSKLKPYVQFGFNNNIEVQNDLKTFSNGYFLEAFGGGYLYYNFLETWSVGLGYRYQTALSNLYKTDEFNLRTNSFLFQINYTPK